PPSESGQGEGNHANHLQTVVRCNQNRLLRFSFDAAPGECLPNKDGVKRPANRDETRYSACWASLVLLPCAKPHTSPLTMRQTHATAPLDPALCVNPFAPSKTLTKRHQCLPGAFSGNMRD